MAHVIEALSKTNNAKLKAVICMFEQLKKYELEHNLLQVLQMALVKLSGLSQIERDLIHERIF